VLNCKVFHDVWPLKNTQIRRSGGHLNKEVSFLRRQLAHIPDDERAHFFLKLILCPASLSMTFR